MVAHALNSSIQEVEAGISELEASLVYRVRFRTARVTQTNPVLKNQKRKRSGCQDGSAFDKACHGYQLPK